MLRTLDRTEHRIMDRRNILITALAARPWKGFLPQSQCKSVFDITNLLVHSNDFTDAAWPKSGTGVAAPTITANTALAPDGTMTASTLVLPAISTAGNESVVFQRPAQSASHPYTGDLYVRGIVGGETLWIWATPDGTTFNSVKIVATLSWQRIPARWTRGDSDWYLQFGRSLKDAAQTAQPAASVYIAWSQMVEGNLEWPYVPTTTAAATASTTLQCPPTIRFRDFSALTPYAGNPIIAQNTRSWNAGGTDSPATRTENQFGGLLFGATENNQNSPANQADWNQLATYTASPSNPLAWTAPTNPAITNTVGNWDEKYLLHPSDVQVGSLWYRYYSAQTAAGVSGIGLATATDPINGPWTKFGTVALVTGNGQALPTVIKIGSLLYMYVAISNVGVANNGTRIDYYTSPASDGITWTYGGIALPLSTSDWENIAGLAGVFDPFVFRNSRNFYEMPYSVGNTTGGFYQKIGYAISADGNPPWFKYQPASPFPISATHTDYAGDPVFFQGGGKFNFFTANTTNGTVCQGMAYTMPDH